MDSIRIFSPATVANVSCGFDAMGFALETLGDEMIFKKNNSGKVTISRIEGAQLPFEVEKNAAGVVAQNMLSDAQNGAGIEIQIFKRYKPGSGLGSSAASSSGAAFAVNKLLGSPYNNLQLVKFAMLGEEIACGSQIADNVAACLYGGFILVRSYHPLDVISIPTPNDLYVTVIHPQIELKTEDLRRVIPPNVPLKRAITQWANVGGFISGLHTNNYDLMGRSLVDVIVEPVRKKFIPHFDLVKDSALANGAMGAGISGSGPSIFALSKGEANAKNVGVAMDKVYKNKNLDYHIYVSKIGSQGARILN